MADMMHDEGACARLLLHGAWHADRQDLDGMVSVFAEDAVLERMGRRIEGKAAIRALFAQRLAAADRSRILRHLMCPPVIMLTGPDTAEGQAAYALHEGLAGGKDGLAPLMIGEFFQRFSRQDGRWWVIYSRNDALFA